MKRAAERGRRLQGPEFGRDDPQPFFAGTIRSWQLILPHFGTVQGPFQIVALEFAADHAGEVTFELALESAGEITFVAI